jgi:hypothetical protein
VWEAGVTVTDPLTAGGGAAASPIPGPAGLTGIEPLACTAVAMIPGLALCLVRR